MRVLLTAVFLVASAQAASAQDAWGGRVRGGLSAGVQPGSAGFTQATSVTDYLEPTPIGADLTERGVPFYDVSLAVRVAGDLGVALGVSGLSTRADALVSADVPHPFYFDRPRAIEGQAFNLRRVETGLHAGLAYVARVSERVDVMLTGGATRFQVRQDLVSDVSYTEAFPFDTATFSAAQVVRSTASKVGYHAGVDVTWRVSPAWGFGALVRFARARVPFEVNGTEAGVVRAGGLQAGGGIRFSY